MIINFEKFNYTLYQSTNTVRKNNNLSMLSYSDNLSILPSLHSTPMKKFNFFSHSNRHNKDLKDLKDRFSFLNFNFSKVSENIADIPYLNTLNEKVFEIRKDENLISFYLKINGKQFNFHTIDSFSDFVVNAWMNSKGHTKNILDNEVTHLGCGAVLYYGDINNEGDKLPYLKLTQNFGRI